LLGFAIKMQAFVYLGQTPVCVRVLFIQRNESQQRLSSAFRIATINLHLRQP
jgi:hypothetical protein